MRPLLFFIACGGFAGALFFGYYTFVDFALLRKAYVAFEQLTPSSSTGAILLAEAKQNIYRINVFADGTWTLLSILIAAVGVHGLATSKNVSSK